MVVWEHGQVHNQDPRELDLCARDDWRRAWVAGVILFFVEVVLHATYKERQPWPQRSCCKLKPLQFFSCVAIHLRMCGHAARNAFPLTWGKNKFCDMQNPETQATKLHETDREIMGICAGAGCEDKNIRAFQLNDAKMVLCRCIFT